jgi:hypothetical protein
MTRDCFSRIVIIVCNGTETRNDVRSTQYQSVRANVARIARSHTHLLLKINELP